jgi:hypothetical protein
MITLEEFVASRRDSDDLGAELGFRHDADDEALRGFVYLERFYIERPRVSNPDQFLLQWGRDYHWSNDLGTMERLLYLLAKDRGDFREAA